MRSWPEDETRSVSQQAMVAVKTGAEPHPMHPPLAVLFRDLFLAEETNSMSMHAYSHEAGWMSLLGSLPS